MNKAPTFTSQGFAMSQKNCIFMTYNHIYVSKDTLSGLQSQTNDTFPQRLDKDIAGNDPVRVVDAVIDSLNLENFRKLYKERGRSPYHPNMMLKVVIYGYMNNLYSCRKIESALKRDIHFIWLACYEQPDFNTINRFRNRVKDEINRIFTQLVIILAEKGFLTLDAEYIDGTKIESKANK